ncbi:unnamed protein product [Pleuronectes platessa]|uniref:Uncharacterized protein n=1 Tax=Pleuronectes platessa TaxID=8262 RepID=A0A9N7U531_PLEPL|nr:unnamed protein product [Pleuronectes platessa]
MCKNKSRVIKPREDSAPDTLGPTSTATPRAPVEEQLLGSCSCSWSRSRTAQLVLSGARRRGGGGGGSAPSSVGSSRTNGIQTTGRGSSNTQRVLAGAPAVKDGRLQDSQGHMAVDGVSQGREHVICAFT